MGELEFATKTARKSQAKDSLSNSETYGQGKMKSGRAAKDMRINGRHMHDLSTPGVWRLEVQGDDDGADQAPLTNAWAAS